MFPRIGPRPGLRASILDKRTIRACLAAMALALLLAAAPPTAGREATAEPARALSLSERVQVRRAIEGVLWAHRIWPKENLRPKPTLDEWLPKGALEREVEDDLRKSDALARRWGRPITHGALQAELDRIARDSRAPDVLREILDALHGDSFLAAEVLARHSLVERLVHASYAYDARVHGEIRRRAVEERGHIRNLETLRTAGDQFAESRIELAAGGGRSPKDDEVYVERLDRSAWDERVRDLLAAAGLREKSTERALLHLPIGLPGPLEEGEHEFTVTAVTAVGEGRVSLAKAVWEKRPFDDWWREARASYNPDVAVTSGDYVLQPLAPPGNPCANDTWYPITRNVPGARAAMAAVWTGSEMIVWGGASGSGVLADGGRYRPDTDTWIGMSSTGAVPSARAGATAVWTGTEMIVWGGYGGGPIPTGVNTGGRYNPALDTWNAVTTSNAPDGRYDHTAVWTGSVMIVWGGEVTDIPYLNTGGVYDPSLDTWSPTSTTGAPSGRIGHTASWLNNEMIVWGGDNGFLYLDSGGRYNPVSNTWQLTTQAGQPGARAWHSAAVMGGRILIWGGQYAYNGAYGGGAFYSPDFWSPIGTAGDPPPSPRMKHTATVVEYPAGTGNYRMVVFGGVWPDASGNLVELNSSAVYRNTNARWQAMNQFGGPGARHADVAFDIGERVLVWGGAFGTSVLGDGRIYNMALDSWGGVSSSGTPDSPSPRFLHTLTWNGSEMIVWGGQGANGFPFDNAAYAPWSDTWYQVPFQPEAPTRIASHTTVWTGSDIIIWGGMTSHGATNTGAVWDISGNWTPMTTNFAPNPREYHSAVWTGSSLVVWGGYDGAGTYLDDGAAWVPDPSPFGGGDSWNPISSSGLGTRIFNSTVWTGDRMIVFGGSNSTNIWNDGASYDPYSDIWSLLPPVNAPAPRTRHSSVLAGNEMIVWGGTGLGLNKLSDGRRFDLQTNTWKSLSPSGLAAREFAAATWTGREMLVWGGAIDLGLAGDGARYNPDFQAWTPMTRVGAPSPRFRHPAIGAGNELITWGGQDIFGNPLDTGARYCASCPDVSSFELATDLTFASSSTLVWTGTSGIANYGLARGTLGVGPPGYNHGCLQSGLTSPTATDASLPPVGTGYYYLVGGWNGCSRTGFGRASSGAPRPNFPFCP
jgi:N-acetylneuraminic acid mutarotase